MAEGIARHGYPDLATYGSAGTMAVTDSPPTDAAHLAAGEIGVDISGLRGHAVTEATDPLPDHIYVMTERHLDNVKDALPHVADRVELLDPDGEIADPYGFDIDFYRQTRDQIVAAIDRRSAEWTEDAG